MIKKHYTVTNSALAGRILEEWTTYLSQFIKVIPVEYQRALEKQAALKVQSNI
jgi:glutamate synthase (NADPH/NADH) large chain